MVFDMTRVSSDRKHLQAFDYVQLYYMIVFPKSTRWGGQLNYTGTTLLKLIAKTRLTCAELHLDKPYAQTQDPLYPWPEKNKTNKKS